MKIEKLQDSLELTNDGGLSFFFVGVGSAFSKKHYQNNILIVKGNDHILVDCGITCPTALYNYGSNITKIKNILITHSHADHIGGLEEAALMGRYVTKSRPKMYITKQYKKLLWNQSLRGGNSYGEMSAGRFLTFDDYFELVEPKLISKRPRPIYETNCGSINIKIFRTRHIPDNAGSWKKAFYSTGILIDDRILFPADTQFDRELIDWMTSTYPIEYIFHDCQFYTGGVHASYDELKTLPETVRNKMYLCHYGDNFESFSPEADGFIGFAKEGHFYHFDK